MALPIEAVQRALKEEKLDGWLLYDFHGSNPIASRLSGLASSGKMATRRWYYFVPATGAPRGLVHAIERHNLDELPGEKRVDAGTIEAVRQCGASVVSSGDLAQRFEAVWTDAALATHLAAAERLYRIKDRAFGLIRERMAAGAALTEIEVQEAMVEWFREEGLVSSEAPNVSAQENAGNPHYQATRAVHRAIRPNEVVLIDLWGKLPTPGAVFADITWMGFTGTAIPPEFSAAFAAVRDGRDAAVALVQSAVREGRELRGFEVDRACRAAVERAGFGAQFIHRTGHSLGEEVHGNGVHMDDYETHDDRRLLPGTGFTIEPGVYTDRYGVRTEINMFVGEREARVTGPLQQNVVTLI
jgi:Xaa-Pro dipeptidase